MLAVLFGEAEGLELVIQIVLGCRLGRVLMLG